MKSAVLSTLLAVLGFDQPAQKLALHVVPTPIKSYRLLAMSMDDDGFIWAGAIHKVVHRYDPDEVRQLR